MSLGTTQRPPSVTRSEGINPRLNHTPHIDMVHSHLQPTYGSFVVRQGSRHGVGLWQHALLEQRGVVD